MFSVYNLQKTVSLKLFLVTIVLKPYFRRAALPSPSNGFSVECMVYSLEGFRLSNQWCILVLTVISLRFLYFEMSLTLIMNYLLTMVICYHIRWVIRY